MTLQFITIEILSIGPFLELNLSQNKVLRFQEEEEEGLTVI